MPQINGFGANANMTYKAPCKSFENRRHLFGLVENTAVKVCVANEGATLGEIREYTGAKKGAVSYSNQDLIRMRQKEQLGVRLDNIELHEDDKVYILTKNLPIKKDEDGKFGTTVNGNRVYFIQEGDTKSSIAHFADVQGYPEYSLPVGKAVYTLN